MLPLILRLARSVPWITVTRRRPRAFPGKRAAKMVVSHAVSFGIRIRGVPKYDKYASPFWLLIS